MRQLLADSLSVERPALEDDLLHDGLIDSLALVELLFELEGQFGITIPMNELDIEDFRTPARIVTLVGRYQPAGS